MSMFANDSDAMYVNDYGEPLMREPLASALADLRMAELPFVLRYHQNDERSSAIIDSLILDLLEELARLKCESDATLPNHALFEGASPGKEATNAPIGDVR